MIQDEWMMRNETKTYSARGERSPVADKAKFMLLVFMLALLLFPQYLKPVNSVFTTIQQAIDNASPGDTVFVPPGTYYENVVIDKTLALIGEDSGTTIIDGNKTGTVVTVEASNVRISGFTIQNSGNTSESSKYPIDCGIKLNATLTPIQNTTITNNIIMNNSVGIYAKCSNNNTVSNNTCSGNIGSPYYRVWEWINLTLGIGHIVLKGTTNDVYFLMSNESLIQNNQGVMRLYNCSNNALLNCSEAFLQFSSLNTLKDMTGSALLNFSHSNFIQTSLGNVTLSKSDRNTLTNCTDDILLRESCENTIQNNRLAPGKSIREEVVSVNSSVRRVGSHRNIVEENTLINGTIKFGEAYTLRGNTTSNANVIGNNTLFEGEIYVCGSDNTITGNNASRIFVYGGPPFYTTNNTVSWNCIRNSSYVEGYAPAGLEISCDQSTIENNVVEFCHFGALFSGSNNNYTGNSIRSNFYGCMTSIQRNNTLRDNEIYSNKYGLISELGIAARDYTLGQGIDIDDSNSLNGKRIYLLENKTDLDVNPVTFPNAGYIGLIGCSNVTVHGFVLENNGEGMLVSGCSNCTIEENVLRNNIIGFKADADNTVIRGNLVAENWHGVTLMGEHNTLAENTISNNTIRLSPYRFPEHWVNDPISYYLFQYQFEYLFMGGVFLYGAQNCTITGNNITENDRGILMRVSSFNVLRNNSMSGNFYNFGVDPDYVLFPPEWVINPPNPPQISPYLSNDVDASNLVDGKPICWWVNRHGERVPSDSGYVLLVNSSNVYLENLVLQNNTEGILLVDVSDAIVSNVTVMQCQYGVRASWGHSATMQHYVNPTNITVTNSRIIANGAGIYLDYVDSCSITANTLHKNHVGVHALGNLTLIRNNELTNNTLPPREEWLLGYEPLLVDLDVFYYYGFGFGILLESANNTVCYNTIESNDCGLGTDLLYRRSTGNNIFHNNFINNTLQLRLASNETWDDGYPAGGNYWSDYNGTDNYSGQAQDQIGSDAIGDTPYQVGQWVYSWRGYEFIYQFDPYPLKAPISNLEAGTFQNTTYYVDIISNSSVSDFSFDPDAKLLAFNVTGDDGTRGFCRVVFLKSLLWCDNDTDWTITVGDEQIADHRIVPDENSVYLYFGYNHSTKAVVIQGTHVIPEFPSFLILSPFMVVTLLTLIVHRKRGLKNRKTNSDDALAD